MRNSCIINSSERDRIYYIYVCMKKDKENNKKILTTWVTLKVFRFAILLAPIKIILLRLFKVMSVYTNALIYSFERVFKTLVEIFFSETFHSFLDSSVNFIVVLKIIPRSRSLIFGNSQKPNGLKSESSMLDYPST